ncbi:hypothetical protein CHS0354_020651 [Potamilus streckersoni]|uniref:Uncharacterized protein n=1 Tax=Potamilus streckersoni TaxID=2493646 RepID=A0AAE0T2G1_9BIVA|nr:hypothetical protein CHS0354_020651 [Potamilus streckersoni]
MILLLKMDLRAPGAIFHLENLLPRITENVTLFLAVINRSKDKLKDGYRKELECEPNLPPRSVHNDSVEPNLPPRSVHNDSVEPNLPPRSVHNDSVEPNLPPRSVHNDSVQ